MTEETPSVVNGEALEQVPTASLPQIFDANAQAERALVVRAVVGELSRELMHAFGDIKKDIEENTRLLGVMNVPMEAITESHERASASFETLRRDIFDGGISKLEQVLDATGLAEAASKTERRLEALIERLNAKIDAAFKAHAKDMVMILHLLERLQARELRETKTRMQKAASRAIGKHRR